MANLKDLPETLLPENGWEITAEMLQRNPGLLDEVIARSRRQRSAYIKCQSRRLLESLRPGPHRALQTTACA